jgi:PAS domain S-box-containing protein
MEADIAFKGQADQTQAILDNVLDGIITIDAKGIVSSFNKSAEHIFGYAAIEVVGRNVSMLVPEPHHSQHDSYLHNYLSTRQARVIGIGRELEGRRKGGATFPMELAVSEIRYQDKPLFIGVVRDITERKRVERMKNEFVSTVSHELRTPLTSIAGALKLMAGDALGILPDTAKPLMHIALRNSERLTHLINDLLDMEKIAAGKLHFDMQIQPLMPMVEQALEANKAYGEQYQVLRAEGERRRRPCEGGHSAPAAGAGQLPFQCRQVFPREQSGPGLCASSQWECEGCGQGPGARHSR